MTWDVSFFPNWSLALLVVDKYFIKCMFKSTTRIDNKKLNNKKKKIRDIDFLYTWCNFYIL